MLLDELVQRLKDHENEIRRMHVRSLSVFGSVARGEAPDAPDGIEYRCRHDDESFAVALFDRARGGIVAPPGASSQLSADPARVSKLSARYGFGLSL